MHEQSNRPTRGDGGRRGRLKVVGESGSDGQATHVALGVTHCDRCGAPDRPLNVEGWCPMCQKIDAHAGHEAGTSALEAVRGMLQAFAGRLHPDDVREAVDEELPSDGVARLSEMGERIDDLYLAGVR